MSTILVALVLAALGASRAQGTEEWSFEAFQPIWTDNDISISRVTVLTLRTSRRSAIRASSLRGSWP
jgi:hypothetical protein